MTPTQPTPGQGGQPANQNARRHGYYSATNPPTYDQLIAAAKNAIRNRNPSALDTIARAHGAAGRHDDARYTRELARVLRVALGVIDDLSGQAGGAEDIQHR